MNEIQIISGELKVGTKMARSGMIELVAINDQDHESVKIVTLSQKLFNVGDRVNAVGQWRSIRHGSNKEIVFYAAKVFQVQHLLDTDESWLSDLDATEIQKQQLHDGNCILQKIGVTKETARKLNLRHKNKLLQTLITTPFKILEEEGNLSFASAEKFAKELGLAPTTSDRAAAGVRDILKKRAELTLAEFKRISINEYCLFWPIIPEILKRMESDHSITVETQQESEPRIIIHDLERSKKATTIELTTGNIATDLLVLREAEDSFIWEEVVRTISQHTQSPVTKTSSLVMVIDTPSGDFPRELFEKINLLAKRIGANILYCSALKAEKHSKITPLERYLVGLNNESIDLVMVEDSQFLDSKKLQYLVKRLKKTVGLILIGDSSYKPEKTPLGSLAASRKILNFKLEPSINSKGNKKNKRLAI